MKFFKITGAVLLGALSLMLWAISVMGFASWASGEFDGGDFTFFVFVILAAALSTAGCITVAIRAAR